MFKAIILAAGKGTRMNSDIPKVLNKVNGKAMVQYVIDNCKENNINDINVIVGYKADEVKQNILGKVNFIMQKELLGTGHAVMQAVDYINDEDDIIVLSGDQPLFTARTIKKFMESHISNNNVATILTNIPDDPASYGRIIRNSNSEIIGIVERKDANQEQINISEVNSGQYCFKGKQLKDALKMVGNNNSQKEYYLTDTIKIMVDAGFKVGGYIAEDHTEALGVNTVAELENAERIMKERLK